MRWYVFVIIVKEGEIEKTDRKLWGKKIAQGNIAKTNQGDRSKKEKRDSVSAKEMITLILWKRKILEKQFKGSNNKLEVVD